MPLFSPSLPFSAALLAEQLPRCYIPWIFMFENISLLFKGSADCDILKWSLCPLQSCFIVFWPHLLAQGQFDCFPFCEYSFFCCTEFLKNYFFISSVQSLSRVWLLATPWISALQASLSITNSRSSLKLMSIKSVMSSSHLIFCRPLLLLPPIPPSIRVVFNESNLCMRWPKYWSFSFSISPSKEHPRLISFRMDW